MSPGEILRRDILIKKIMQTVSKVQDRISTCFKNLYFINLCLYIFQLFDPILASVKNAINNRY